MKKLFLTLAAFSALTFTSVAQNGNRTAQNGQQAQLSPEQRAEKQTKRVASNLNLSDAQMTTFRKLALERINANQPLREKAKASANKEEKQNLQKQIKANNEKFYTSVNSMLTPDQQTKWAEHKKKMESNNEANHQD